jgi:hypothetical protein
MQWRSVPAAATRGGLFLFVVRMQEEDARTVISRGLLFRSFLLLFTLASICFSLLSILFIFIFTSSFRSLRETKPVGLKKGCKSAAHKTMDAFFDSNRVVIALITSLF